MTDLNIEDLGFKPVSKAPAQNTFNGIGTRLYGHKKIPESDSLYTKVLYFTIVYVPVLALSKYLASKQDGNEYILGKGSLSNLSKGWNALVATLLVGFIGVVGYQSHTSSPEYIAKKLYENSKEMIEERDFEPAIRNLKLVYEGNSSLSQTAKDKIIELMSAEYLAPLPPEDNLDIISSATKIPALFPKPLDVFVENFEKFESTAPAVASEFASLIVENTNDEVIIQLYDKKNYSLLNGLYENNKNDFGISEKYARLEERLNQCAECLNILEPHIDKLENTEAARILGQAYAANRQTEKAYSLLAPYVATNIKVYHAAEAEYDQVTQKVWDDTIVFLNSDSAPSSFYDKYNNVSEDEQNQLVDEFYIKKRDASVAVTDAKQAYLASTEVVPVALDLGIVLLDKASASSAPDARNSLLEQAEKTFLSVQNYAGDSDEYQLYLGQVYYWLGKEPEGEKLFVALLKKYGRSHQILNSLSSTLRDLGAFSKAREYAVEAYEKATDAKDKQIYAQSIALLARDLDEKVEWLGKADQTSVFVKGDLFAAKGNQAARDNENTKALKYFQQAIGVYEKIPESATQLNNIALIYLSKYDIAFDLSDIEAALTKLDQAVELVPEDSIVLGNAASQHLRKAYSDIQRPLLNLRALEISPSLDTFSYLYSSNDEKSVFRKKLGEHSSFKKGLSYLEKAVLLAPKNGSNFSELRTVYHFMEDENGLFSLVNRFKNLELDLERAKQGQLDYRNGVDAEKNLQGSVDYIARLVKRSNTEENVSNKLNQSILGSYILSSKSNNGLYGRPENSGELLTFARTNYKRNKSSGTRGDLEDAIINHLLTKAKEKIDGFEDYVSEYQRVFGDTSVFTMALSDSIDFKNFVLNDRLHADLRSLIESSAVSFPNSPGVSDWKILTELSSPKASEVREAYKMNKIVEYSRALAFKQSTNQEYISYYQALKQEMLGNLEEAKRLNQAAIDKGLKMPLVY